jgi:two-component system, NarL family, sensor histidine kinase DesK
MATRAPQELAGQPEDGRPARLQRRYWHLGTLFWFVYLFFDLPTVIRASRSGARVGVQLGLLVALAVAYLYVMWRPPADPPPPRRGLAVAVMAAVVVALVVLRFPGQWAPLLLFVSLSLAVVLSRGPAVTAIALTAVATAALSLWQGLPSSTALLHGMQTLIAGLGMLGFLQVLGLNLQLVAAREELARMAVAQERLRFARDLHDLLGHSLSVIALKSELAGGLLASDPARVSSELRDIEQVARRALAEVREAVGGYRRVTLAAELGGARAALEAAGVRAEVDDPPAGLPAPVEEVLGWAVREATTNVVRHSGATGCRIRFDEDNDRVAVEITDNGLVSAFGRRPTDSDRPDDRSGHGLAGLAERVAFAGGRLQAGHRPGGGFRLQVELPLMVPAP